MLRHTASELMFRFALLRRAFGGKLSVMAHGQSPISPSCQVPDLRQRYRDLGLDQRAGFFVEIGGFDGEAFSNTSFLADQGWSGLYVEPVPVYAARIKVRHLFNRIAVETAAIAEQVGILRLHDMGPLSTALDQVHEAYRTIEWSRPWTERAQPVEVRAETLATVLQRHRVPHDLQLMVIDVEGGEVPVVTALLESPWRPRVLIVELCDRHPDFSRSPDLQDAHAALRERLLQSGYREAYSDHINTIFRLAG